MIPSNYISPYGFNPSQQVQQLNQLQYNEPTVNDMDLVQLDSPNVHLNMQELRGMVQSAIKDMKHQDPTKKTKRNIKQIVKKAGGYDAFVDKVAQHFLKHNQNEAKLMERLEKHLFNKVQQHAQVILRKAMDEGKISAAKVKGGYSSYDWSDGEPEVPRKVIFNTSKKQSHKENGKLVRHRKFKEAEDFDMPRKSTYPQHKRSEKAVKKDLEKARKTKKFNKPVKEFDSDEEWDRAINDGDDEPIRNNFSDDELN